jgi:branched-chain amino acid transport system ATP-binding protein
VLIVEHNMELIMRLSHRVVVMAQGAVIADGTPGEVRGDPKPCSRPISAAHWRRRHDAGLLEVKRRRGLRRRAGDPERREPDGPARQGALHHRPNGAGKSTLLKAIVGMLKIRQGEVTFKGEEPQRPAPRPDPARRHLLRAAGARAVPEDDGAREPAHGRLLDGVTSELERRIDEIEDRFPILKERRDQHAGTMSGGQQQTLSMARTMILKPEIVMLDEPSLGLAPKIVKEMFEIMKMMTDEGITILLVEQNAMMGLKNADWGVVLDLGKTLFEGPAKEVLADPRIQELYLGGNKAA